MRTVEEVARQVHGVAVDEAGSFYMPEAEAVIRSYAEEVKRECAEMADGWENGRVYAFLPSETEAGRKIRSLKIP